MRIIPKNIREVSRKISKSDFRDRVVHHALCNIIEPIFEKAFIFESNKRKLEFYKGQIDELLKSKLNLQLHKDKSKILKLKEINRILRMRKKMITPIAQI